MFVNDDILDNLYLYIGKTKFVAMERQNTKNINLSSRTNVNISGCRYGNGPNKFDNLVPDLINSWT